LAAHTSTIPIIATTPDLLASGLVTSLTRPGGNVTGISLTAGPTLGEKWPEILNQKDLSYCDRRDIDRFRRRLS